MAQMLDVRSLPAPQRHAHIFSLLDQLAIGDELILVNDHEPKPLYYQIQATQPGCFAWEPRQTNPREWTVHIRRLRESAPLSDADLPARLPHLSPFLAAGKLVSRYPVARDVLARFNLAPDEQDARSLRSLAREGDVDFDSLMAALELALARQ